MCEGKGGGGGGQNTKCKTPSPNFEELIESITNMLLFLQGGVGKKSYEVSKFGGGGGGGGVFTLNEFLDDNIYDFFFFAT